MKAPDAPAPRAERSCPCRAASPATRLFRLGNRLRFSLWFAGLVSLLWFLVRVVPKPSRAAYPCQRAAAPLASAFVVWLASLLGARWALAQRRSSRALKQPGYAVGCGVVLLMCAALALLSLPRHPAIADVPLGTGPLGEARGIFPGRVVWVHAPDATDWAGFESPERWWAPTHTDLAVVEDMMDQAVKRISGQPTLAGAWDALFKHFHQRRTGQTASYQPGQKIAVKLNLTTCNAGGSGVDSRTYEKSASVMNTIDNSPQMLLCLLRQLVYTVGVRQEDISLGDPTALFPKYLFDFLRAEFPRVRYFDPKGGSGRTRVTFSNTPFYWSAPGAQGKLQDFVPTPFAEADYLINFAILKGHSAGITLCGKNLYGALLRCPNGALYGQGVLDYFDLHLSLPNPAWSPGTGHYRALVDLMGMKQLGDKTLLYLVDGLFAGYYWDSHPYPWTTAPFGTPEKPDWPSSLLVSLDPVAIDSVGYDLLLNEWPRVVTGGTGAAGLLRGGAEDYLHEAALASAAPSGTVYDPEADGTPMPSLGVHEHWNNPVDRQYSRNLGATQGIELVYLRLDRTPPRLEIARYPASIVLSWPSSHTGYTAQTAPNPAGLWTPLTQSPVAWQGRNFITNSPTGPAGYFRLQSP